MLSQREREGIVCSESKRVVLAVRDNKTDALEADWQEELALRSAVRVRLLADPDREWVDGMADFVRIGERAGTEYLRDLNEMCARSLFWNRFQEGSDDKEA